MDQNIIVVGPFMIHRTDQGLMVNTADRQYVLDTEQSLVLSSFLGDHRTGFFKAGHDLPPWVSALREIGMLSAWPRESFEPDTHTSSPEGT